MTDISEIYPNKSPYLKAADLQSRTVTLVIEEVVPQGSRQGRQPRS